MKLPTKSVLFSILAVALLVAGCTCFNNSGSSGTDATTQPTTQSSLGDTILKNQAAIKVTTVLSTQVYLANISDAKEHANANAVLYNAARATLSLLNDKAATVDDVQTLLTKYVLASDSKYRPTLQVIFAGLSDLINQTLNNAYSKYEADARFTASRALVRSVAEGVLIVTTVPPQQSQVDEQVSTLTPDAQAAAQDLAAKTVSSVRAAQ